MKELARLLLLTMLLLQATRARHRFNDDRRQVQQTRHTLQELLKRLQLNMDETDDNQDLFYERRDMAKTKCKQVETDGYYGGSFGPAIPNVATEQDCMSKCDSDSTCLAWSYSPTSKYCWTQTTVGGKVFTTSYTGGVCCRAATKIDCGEVWSGGYYNGKFGSAIKNVLTVDDCMKKCDADPACIAWSYSSSSTTCWPQTTIDERVYTDSYVGGSCSSVALPQPKQPISIDTFRKQALDQHNIYRKKHCVADLTLNSELNDIAQQYAEKLAASRKFEHSGNKWNGKGLGENLAGIGTGAAYFETGDRAVTLWYNEITVYNWTNPNYQSAAGHFTQVVWKASNLLGIGRGVTADKSAIYVVANYYPPGNLISAMPQNVLPLC